MSECTHILFLVKIVHCLCVSVTTDTLGKAIMDPSSIQCFPNMVSVTREGLGWCWGTLFLVFQVPEIV